MTKKKIALIVVASVLGALIVLGIILFFTTFSLKTLDVEFETTNHVYDEAVLSERISQSCEVDFKKSVFLMDKQKTMSSIEKTFPDLKVVNIETKFPASVTIHLALRQQLYAFEKAGKFFVTDEDLKVLEIKDSFVSSKNNAILVEGLAPNNEEIQLCDILEFDNFDGAHFKNINLALFKNNRNKLESMAYFKSMSFQKRVNPESFEDETTLVLKSHLDFVYEIFDFESRLETKLNKLFACDVTIENFDRSQYELLIYENSNGEIFAKLKSLI